MIVTEDFVLLHLEKTGGNFIKMWMKKAFGYEKFPGREHVGLKEKPKNKLVIGGIRNPFERYVSCWRYLCDRGGVSNPANEEHFRNGSKFEDYLHTCFYGSNYTNDYAEIIPYRKMQELEMGYMTYKFLRLYGNIDINKLDEIPNILEVSMVDKYYETSTLGYDIEKIFHENLTPLTGYQINLLNQMPRTHVTEKSKSFRDYYNNKYRKLIEERDAQIFKAFGYSFEDLK